MNLWFKCCKNSSCSCSCIFSKEIAGGVWEVIMARTVLYKISKKHMAAFALEATSHFGQTPAVPSSAKYFLILCVLFPLELQCHKVTFHLGLLSSAQITDLPQKCTERENSQRIHCVKSLWTEDYSL